MRTTTAAIGLACALAALGACGDDDAAPAADAGPGAADADLSPDANPLVVERPYMMQVPDSYDASKPTPLVLLLHGYAANAFVQVRLFGLLDGSQAHGYIVVYPDGLTDSQGNQFWNATDGCCNVDGNPVDDVAYLSAVLDDVEAHYNVDPKRVYVMGHSNGGYMAHRLACDVGGRIAAIISLAGMTWKDPTKCPAGHLVNVLQVHGDADGTVPYEGNAYIPSAPETVHIWAQKNGCSGADAIGPGGDPIDLVVDLDGAETTKQSYEGCPPGGAVDFWTIHGGGHIPNFEGATWESVMWTWLDAHPKP